MNTSKVGKYDSINVNVKTKLRVDKIYYKIKVDKKLKTFDQFINYILDLVEKK